jgi:hypothetical protein
MKRAGRGGAWGGLVLAALLACVGGGEAAAQEGEGANKPPEKVIKDTQSVLTEEERRFLKEKQEGPSQTYTILPRFRLVSIPDAALGLFLERHSESWGDGPNLAYGLEFLLQNPAYAWSFSLEFADISRPDDWFLESGDPARKADWTTFPLQLINLNVGVQWFFDLSEVFSFYVGAGLGAGIVLGEVEKTDPSDECVLSLGETKDAARLDQAPCYVGGQPRLQAGSTEVEDRIPPVLPLINLTGGMQVIAYEHLVWRLEVGFNDYVFAGTSLGYKWW